MQLHPPKAIVDENDPFKHALFGRKEFAESLTSLLRNVSEGLVIFINAPWGEGKTTFAQMWRAHLRGEKLDTIYFDAYAADYISDPFVSFSGEILELVKQRLAEVEGIEEPRRKFQEAAVEVGKKLAGLTAKVGLRALTMGALDLADVSNLKEAGTEMASGVSDIGAELIEKRIENYAKEKDSLKVFKASLAKLAAIVREQQDFPLTIIVDEMDRCRPDFALGLLERIKHLFDVENVVFVLLVNREQIESYVRTVYGESVNASAYLLKFANLFVDLPNLQAASSQENGRQGYCQLLLQHHGFSSRVENVNTLTRSLGFLTDHFNLTLREIDKLFTTLTVYYSSRSKNQLTHDFLIVLLAVLKTHNHRLYRQLAAGKMSAASFLKKASLDKPNAKAGNQPTPDYMNVILNFCLMSDTEFKEAVKAASESGKEHQDPSRFWSWLAPYGMDRKQIIPFLCVQLNRFSILSK